MIFQEPMSSLNPVYTCGFRQKQYVAISMFQRQARRQAIAGLQEVKLIPSDKELEQQYVGSSG